MLRNQIQKTISDVQEGTVNTEDARGACIALLSQIDEFERALKEESGANPDGDAFDRVKQLRRLYATLEGEIEMASVRDDIQTQLDTNLRTLRLKSASGSTVGHPWTFHHKEREIRNHDGEVLVIFPNSISDAMMNIIGNRLVEKSAAYFSAKT